MTNKDLKIMIVGVWCLLIFWGCVMLTGCPESSPSTVPATQKSSWDKPEWDKFLAEKVDENFAALSMASDVTIFCPKFGAIDEASQKLAWKELFIWVMFHESGWDPLSRYHETTMGKDPVTNLPVHSEGLFQMSYQDESWAKCGFDWSKDRTLDDKDPKKTILDPYLNMNCGVKVMAAQIKRTKKIVLRTGMYWAVLRENGRYTKVNEIATSVKKQIKQCEGI